MQTGYIDVLNLEGSFRGTLLVNGVGRNEDFLQEGQIIEGKVIFASEETANVRLNNGAVLRARLSDEVTLMQGDTVLLSVKANDGENLVLQIVAGDTAEAMPEGTPAGMLSKAGLRTTPLNLSLVSALHDCGLRMEAETVRQAAVILKNFLMRA